ncbi:MAG: energy coupling factor transporter S component ThiW [Butyrivibrio sp.]|uniref:energy coupling factor transporter S component ThiW n=1 Tax=Butyrivibrio sp. TaxID=28121 RepID=UPI001B3CA854|nr:energy coupling factor transporter S component ThiW [Butyrivibrio sp.]MBP3279085.1 energy coupling factor transporter S component ThiW [Butyrivibrio sp.]MBP3783157.1 energy coupling factor transporter S component ThiW [Butyrivibrio sp.]MBP3814696.1 energy coupling factor transporter S component ThiW [Butyrivibrio sp.]
MKRESVVKLVLSGMFVALAVVLSTFSIPVGGSKCFPIQHMVNVLAAVFLGPWYGVGIAFCTSLIRNILGTGTLLAFPGSMIGALCCGLVYKHTGKLTFTYIAEVIGTGILGGLLAYPVAAFVMGKEVALFVYVVPFLVSTIGGTVIAAVLITILKANHTLEVLQNMVKEGKVKG